MFSIVKLRLLVISLLMLILCYLLAFFAFPNQTATRVYVLLIFFGILFLGFLLGSLRRDRQIWRLVNDLKLQIQNKEAAQALLTQASMRLRRQNSALATLTAKYLSDWQTPEEVFHQISQVSAKVLDVERVSLSMFSEDAQSFQCVDMYYRSSAQHMSGDLLSAKDYPGYFHALSIHRVLAVKDAMHDEATAELAKHYLPSKGIGALLDGTIWLNDKPLGLISHEHVGGPREWTLDEQNFVGSLVDLIRLTAETHRRRLAEAELMQHRDQLEEMVRLRTIALENNVNIDKFLVARAPVNILYMNRKTEVLEMNPEAVEVSGYSRDDAIGKTFYELFSNDEMKPQHLALFKRVIAGEKVQGVDLQMRNSNGVVRDYSVSVSLEQDSDGEPVIISIAQDKSHQKALENSLIKAREAAESADRIKSMFVASMSHELRTPLNSIIGFIGVVLQGMSGEINDKQKEQLSRAYGSAKHLLSLITDVIDISKIEAGYLQVQLEQFNLLPLLLEVEQVVRHLAEEKKLAISIDCPNKVMLETDRKRLYQVVLNVMSNAVKYTEKGSVHVKAVANKNQVTISVQDTGIGLSEHALANLFKPFERAESRLRIKILGTGLGLYLTKKILTQLLGGSIEVESKPEVGSTFSIEIPLKAPYIAPEIGSVLERP